MIIGEQIFPAPSVRQFMPWKMVLFYSPRKTPVAGDIFLNFRPEMIITFMAIFPNGVSRKGIKSNRDRSSVFPEIPETLRAPIFILNTGIWGTPLPM